MECRFYAESISLLQTQAQSNIAPPNQLISDIQYIEQNKQLLDPEDVDELNSIDKSALKQSAIDQRTIYKAELDKIEKLHNSEYSDFVKNKLQRDKEKDNQFDLEKNATSKIKIATIENMKDIDELKN